MLKIIIYIIVFYFIYKAAKFFVRYLISSKKDSSSFKKNSPAKSKYQNVEEAEFKDIPDKNENQKKQSP